MHTASEFLTAGLLLALALASGRTASMLGLPRVAAYLAVGIVFSPTVLGEQLGLHLGPWKESFTTGALGIIAYLIGGSMTVAQLRRMGRIILVSTLGETIGAMLLVFLCAYCLFSLQSQAGALPLALSLGVLAMSTDAVSTLAVIHQFRARGPLTDALLGIVALDDALGVICYSLLLATLANGSLGGTVQAACWEIGGAIAVGAVGGWLLWRVSGFFGESGMRLPLVLSATLLVLGIAENLQLSVLLAAMSLGFFARMCARASAQRLFNPMRSLEETIFLLFFALAGTSFDAAVFASFLPLIVLYVIARLAGKTLGVGVATKMAGAPAPLVRWLGVGLMPQAGVAVGLALILSHQTPLAESGVIITNVIVGATLLHELFGPLAVQFALRQAGEVQVKRERHRHEGF